MMNKLVHAAYQNITALWEIRWADDEDPSRAGAGQSSLPGECRSWRRTGLEEEICTVRRPCCRLVQDSVALALCRSRSNPCFVLLPPTPWLVLTLLLSFSAFHVIPLMLSDPRRVLALLLLLLRSLSLSVAVLLSRSLWSWHCRRSSHAESVPRAGYAAPSTSSPLRSPGKPAGLSVHGPRRAAPSSPPPIPHPNLPTPHSLTNFLPSRRSKHECPLALSRFPRPSSRFACCALIGRKVARSPVIGCLKVGHNTALRRGLALGHNALSVQRKFCFTRHPGCRFHGIAA